MDIKNSSNDLSECINKIKTENKRNKKRILMALAGIPLLIASVTGIGLKFNNSQPNQKRIIRSQQLLGETVNFEKNILAELKILPATKENIGIMLNNKNATELFNRVVMNYKQSLSFSSEDINVMIMLFESFNSGILREIYSEKEIEILRIIYDKIRRQIAPHFKTIINNSKIQNSNFIENGNTHLVLGIKKIKVTPEFIEKVKRTKKDIYVAIFKKFKKNYIFNQDELGLLFTIIEDIPEKTLRKIFSKRELRDLKYIHLVLRNRISIRILRKEAEKFYLRNRGKPVNVTKHIAPDKIGRVIKKINNRNILSFVELNENLSANLFKLCKEFKLNYKLIAIIALIENNFGNTKTSSTGAKSYTQAKDIIRKKYFPNDKSNWAYLKSSLMHLKEQEKLLGINISNLKKIDPVDLIVALIFYHDGLTRILEHPEKVLVEESEGLNYVKKGITLLIRYNFEIPKGVISVAVEGEKYYVYRVPEENRQII